jgi:hypothetical protein
MLQSPFPWPVWPLCPQIRNPEYPTYEESSAAMAEAAALPATLFSRFV